MQHSEERHTFDLDIQHNIMFGERNSVVWGTGLRVSADRLGVAQPVFLQPQFVPRDKNELLWNLFLQDEIALLPKLLMLTLGARLEHNDYTGFEFQPTARLLWTPHPEHSAWAAVSRGVRTPSRAETGIQTGLQALPAGTLGTDSPEAEVWMFGNAAHKSEELTAYELGYRYLPLPTLMIDTTLFYNDYGRLTGAAAGTPYFDEASGKLIIPYRIANNAKGQTFGGEVSVAWRPVSWAEFDLSYSCLQVQVQSQEKSEVQTTLLRGGTSPRHQASGRSGFTLGKNWKLDLWLRYVGELPQFKVNDYVTMDARLAWMPLKSLELSLTGQNLFGPPHFEFGGDMFGNLPTRSRLGAFGNAIWKF